MIATPAENVAKSFRALKFRISSDFSDSFDRIIEIGTKNFEIEFVARHKAEFLLLP